VPDHPSGRISFNSREVLRRPDGQFEIALSPQARPGNWMPLPSAGALTVVFRLYDTPAANPATAGTVALPRIDWRACR
jgi:hypothetical protein